MKTKLTGLLLLVLVLLPGVALAQNPTIAELTVELWPEYDRPEVLVIQRITLSDSTSLPATLTLNFPPYVDALHAIAVERNGGLFSVEENSIVTTSTAKSLQVTLSVDSPKLQLEYYDPQLLTKQGEQRQIEYTYTADYPVTAARFQVQQPLQASALSLTPAETASFTDQNGVTYKVLDAAGLAAGDSVQISATYTRSTDQPSAELLASQTPVGGQPADIQVITNEGPVSRDTPWGYLLIGVGVLLLLATGGYWWWTNRPQAAAPPRLPSPRPVRPKTRPASRAIPRSQPAGEASGGYCHQCGTALRSDSKFCHVCGAPRRTA